MSIHKLTVLTDRHNNQKSRQHAPLKQQLHSVHFHQSNG